jgi:HSP90 family molecular chaperone
VRIIRKQLVKRALDMMSDLAAKGEDEYEKFWEQFGRNVKLGVVDDQENKEKLASLLRVRDRVTNAFVYWQLLAALGKCSLVNSPRFPETETSSWCGAVQVD